MDFLARISGEPAGWTSHSAKLRTALLDKAESVLKGRSSCLELCAG